MRTADVSKFLLAVFERPYDGLYISFFLVAAVRLYQKKLHFPI